MITTLKEFGRGQITLPKKWRDKHGTEIYLAKETPQGLLIIPITDQLLDASATGAGLFRKASIRKHPR